MRLGAAGKPNATIGVPGRGSVGVKISSFGEGWGPDVVEETTRTGKAFASDRVIDTAWFIEIEYSDVRQRNAVNSLLLRHVIAASDPYGDSVGPISVSIPSEGFSRSGYISGSLEFGDRFGVGVYRTLIQFTSLENATLEYQGGSSLSFTGDSNSTRTPTGYIIRTVPDPISARWGDGI